VIHAQTSNGKKNLILRGWKGPRGLKGFVQGRVTTAAGDQQFWDGSAPPSPVVTATPESVSGGVSSSTPSAIVTSASVVSVTGGSPPYSYAWALTSDDGAGGTWTAVSPATAGTPFRASAVAGEGTSLAHFRCTVTDARGAVGTADVNATARNYPV
jgi:hypothetical protein